MSSTGGLIRARGFVDPLTRPRVIRVWSTVNSIQSFSKGGGGGGGGGITSINKIKSGQDCPH